MREEDFRDHEYYEIRTDGDGRRYVHILGFVWKNDGREHPHLVDEEGYPLVAPYTSTEYTGVQIPLGELIACRTARERMNLIDDCEGACQQYEGDYTWEEFVEEGYDGPHGGDLDYADIWWNTPDGCYQKYFRGG